MRVKNFDSSINLQKGNLIYSLELQLLKDQEEEKPLFQYHCPKNPMHKLSSYYQVFDERFDKKTQTSPYLDDPEITRIKEKLQSLENSCGHKSS